ncbi:MFS transporter [Vibrio rhodolitus]|uniref:MFS transporter n=1 Tax=Vibrio rhodolitus TaxID=2231649 RepID=UPI000E0AB927|nr:MFS transporter [Vibrio rhodolitus]
MSSQPQNHWRTWLAVVTLGIASFIVVTTELAPIGMLSAIANDMAQDPSTTGLVVTLYAWLASAAAIISVMTISHLPRRPLMIGLMLLLGLSNALAALTDQFSLLLIARLFGAIAHGAFWAVIGTLGAQLVRSNSIGRATAIIFGGVSVASVLGVPLMNWVSNLYGWRVSFTLLAILAGITAAALALTLPQVQGAARLTGRQFANVLTNQQLRVIYLIAIFAIVAHFAAFTFVEVLLNSELNIPHNWVAACLLTFGAAGLLGNFVCGALIDKHLKLLLSCALTIVSIGLALIGVSKVTGLFMSLLVVAGWGFGIAILFVALQAWIIHTAGNDALPASAIYAAIFNGAIGTGAVVGSGILEQWGVSTLNFSACLMILLSLMLVLFNREPSQAQVAID